MVSLVALRLIGDPPLLHPDGGDRSSNTVETDQRGRLDDSLGGPTTVRGELLLFWDEGRG